MIILMFLSHVTRLFVQKMHYFRIKITLPLKKHLQKKTVVYTSRRQRFLIVSLSFEHSHNCLLYINHCQKQTRDSRLETVI